jgi:hypothetical protein
MKKMMLLASVVALAALMLAAAPTFADDNHHGRDFCDHHDCVDNNNDEFNVNDRDVFRNLAFGNVGIEAPIDISQDTDQDSNSGDVSQPISVTGGGDNSIQTVGLQPTANTGSSQNATDVLQAAPIVAGFGGDTILNNEDNNVFNNDEDNHNGRDFCDHHDCVDNNDDNGDNGVDFNNRTVNRIGGDRNTIVGPDFGDVDVNTDSSIDVSPAMTVNGGGTIDQAAAAS